MKKTVCFILILFCLLLVQVSAADLYVRQGASGSGTKESPYGELWKALEIALRGDVIHITAGTYTGKGGSGSFIVRVPNLTISGGYNTDFSLRDPFVNKTILQREKEYKGSFTGLPRAMLEGKENSDHSGLVVDGLILNGETRNAYFTSGDLSVQGSWDGVLLATSSANIKIINTVFINPYGGGIYSRWYGEENEVSNCFFINTFYCAVDTRSAQPKSKIRIKNNTISFVWAQPGKAGGMGVNVGSSGEITIEDNLIMFTEGCAVYNSFKNTDTIMRNNVFFQNKDGIYNYLEKDGRNLLVWKSSELEDLNRNPDSYSLWESGGNRIANPDPKPEINYFEGFVNRMLQSKGLFESESLKAVWNAVGLSGDAGSTTSSHWGHKYPIDKLSGLDGALAEGAHRQKEYQAYKSEETAAPADSYIQVDFSAFIKENPDVKNMNNKPVEFFAAMGSNRMVYFDHIADKSDYRCVELNLPGEQSYTRKTFYGYILKGSAAEKTWDKYYAKRDRYNEKGLKIKGRAFYLNSDAYPYPVGVIVDEISAP